VTHGTCEGTLNIEPPTDAVARSCRRKVARRLLPLIFVLYVVAYLDRANAGFAKLQMSEALHFSESEFGRGFGLFFIGYLFLEVPGALIVERWSARKWFARILITWGFCSMATALVRTPAQFYLSRFLLGLAEAGFFPGVIVYLTHWFPRRDRARALAGLAFGVPASLAFGARMSGWLLDQHWLDWAGWQWVFVVEGAPAVLLGIAVLFAFPDRPADARWLTAAEREWLEQTLAAERREIAGDGEMSLGRALRQRNVWLLAVGILAINIGGYALVFWLPTAVQGLLATAGRDSDHTNTLNWLTFIYLCGVAGVWVAGQSSDRTGERKWHCVAGLVVAAGGLALSVVPGQPWPAVFAWLCVAGFGAFFWIPPYWALPTTALTASAAAVAVGVINMCANVAGWIGADVVGEMRDAGVSRPKWVLFMGAGYATGAVILSLIAVGRRPARRPGE
jgi:ACS family tartrate transporter-like MFS transporter